MRIKSHTTIEISRKELLAVASYQDTIASLSSDIGKVFGQSIPVPELSAAKQVKLALGGKETHKFGPVKIVLSKKGVVITISINESLPEEVIEEYFSIINDLVRIYIPPVIGAITGLMAAQAAAQGRIESGAKRIMKAIKNR